MSACCSVPGIGCASPRLGCACPSVYALSLGMALPSRACLPFCCIYALPLKLALCLPAHWLCVPALLLFLCPTLRLALSLCALLPFLCTTLGLALSLPSVHALPLGLALCLPRSRCVPAHAFLPFCMRCVRYFLGCGYVPPCTLAYPYAALATSLAVVSPAGHTSFLSVFLVYLILVPSLCCLSMPASTAACLYPPLIF